MRPSPAAGAVIGGKYRLDELLGEGGMGTVWRATGVHDGREVALKLVKERSSSLALHRRILKEARAACAVVHPNVVRMHEVIELDDGPVLVMELLRGESLAQRLARDGALAPDEAAGILMAISSGVGSAHAKGIVHRDLKPANVFLVKGQGSAGAKVLDFGIAKWTVVDDDAAAETGGLTASGALLGTPCYMSPEQAFGEKDIDHRSDIWSLGIIAYECLTGVLPTRADNVGQVLKIVLTGKIRPLRDADLSLPEGLADLVDRMLAVERANRPADLSEVQRGLVEQTDVLPDRFGPPAIATRSAGKDPAGTARSRRNPVETVDPVPRAEPLPEPRPAAARAASSWLRWVGGATASLGLAAATWGGGWLRSASSDAPAAYQIPPALIVGTSSDPEAPMPPVRAQRVEPASASVMPFETSPAAAPRAADRAPSGRRPGASGPPQPAAREVHAKPAWPAEFGP